MGRQCEEEGRGQIQLLSSESKVAVARNPWPLSQQWLWLLLEPHVTFLRDITLIALTSWLIRFSPRGLTGF